MKRSLLPVFLSFFLVFITSQLVAQVGIGTSTPNAKAVLELKSPGNNQGFLVPRLTTAERTAIGGLGATEKGLLVFDISDNKFYYWSGTAWIVIEDSVGTGTVTTVSTGAGLTGGPITVTGTISLADNGVTTTKILDATISTADLSDGSVTSVKVQDGTIATADIANNAITTAKITDGSVTASKLANTTVTAGSYGTGTQVSQITVDAQGRITSATNVAITGAAPTGTAGGDLTGTYPNPTVANNTITSAKISDATIATADLADGSVTTGKIMDGTVATADIANTAVTDVKIASGVTVSKLSPSSTNGQVLTTVAGATTWAAAPTATGTAGGDLTGSYPNPTIATVAGNNVVSAVNNAATTGSINTNRLNAAVVLESESPTAGDISGSYTGGFQIGSGAVTTTEIADGTIATADIGNTQVTDAKIASGLTVSKLSPSSTNGQVLTTVAGATQWSNAANGTVTSIATGTGLTGGPITGSGTISVAANGITSTELRSDAATDANRAVTTNHIRDNAITTGKITDGTIATADLADGSVTSVKIQDAAIVNADVSATAAVAVSKLAAGTNTNVLTTVAGVPTWQAPADASASNEIQTLSIAGTTLSISSGNSVTLPGGGGVGGSGTAGQVAYWDGSSSIRGDNNLQWDNKNAMLGIGVSPKANLHVGGSQAVSFVVTSVSDYDVTNKDYVILVPSATSNVFLPDASEVPGRVLIIRSGDVDKGVAIRAKNGKDQIDGASVLGLVDRAGEFYAVTLISDGNNWFSISKSRK
ncbi:MAG: hypothetical protein WAZ98_07670 [Cyclobacteriaceae bacterium]